MVEFHMDLSMHLNKLVVMSLMDVEVLNMSKQLA